MDRCKEDGIRKRAIGGRGARARIGIGERR